ncbi:MAG: hypothetical protein ACQEQF_00270 [Bacillota bacterium]
MLKTYQDKILVERYKSKNEDFDFNRVINFTLVGRDKALVLYEREDEDIDFIKIFRDDNNEMNIEVRTMFAGDIKNKSHLGSIMLILLDEWEELKNI